MASRFFLITVASREECLERRRTRRRLRNQLNIPIIPDLEFIKNYRLSLELFEEICRELVPLLPRKAKRHAIDPTIKILAAFNFYAQGSYQGSVGQNSDGPVAQQTVSRCLQEGRWRCLLAARELHYCPETAGKIILACCVLHNICIRAGIDVPELTEDEFQSERSRQVPTESATSSARALEAGRRVRATLMQILERNR
ncbi:hypothetical protein evm_008693 [Chilo suppressalis]|nr:hypothetical protein evm_008693 [Chilo suppressalis]